MDPVTFRRVILGSLSVLAVLVAGLFLFVKGEPAPGGGPYARFLQGELMTFDMSEGVAEPAETSFVDGNGEKVSLADFRGKVILLNLWATWCAPCLNEMPTLDRLKADMASQDFDVIAVSVDKAGVEKSREFLKRTGASHLELFVDEIMQLNFDFSVYQLPTTILIGRDGIEIGRIVGDKDWDALEVKRFLGAIIAEGQDHGSSSLSQ